MAASIRASLARRRSGNVKLTVESVRAIRRRLAAGETAVQVAKDYGVTAKQIRVIERREQWERLD